MATLWIVLAALAGLLLGALAVYAWLSPRAGVATSHAHAAEARLRELQAEHDAAEAELRAARATADATTARLESAESRMIEQREELAAVRSECEQALREVSAARSERDQAVTRLEAAQQNLQDQRGALAEAKAQLRETFSDVGREALRQNNDAFLAVAKQRFDLLAKGAEGDLAERQAQIDGLLKPLRETLDAYQKRLGEIEQSRTATYTDIREQLGSVAETQRSLGVQTQQLVSALRRPGTRGQWGELTLQRLLELAGLSEHHDFHQQASIDGEEGRQRPDLVVELPGDRSIVVDSKYSADDFLKALECDDPQQKRQHLTRFAAAVRRHVGQLSQKSYHSQFERTPEFVVMFLPGEALIYAAAEHDAGLLEDAFRKNVIIATPTTLVALLKTVAHGWREHGMVQNLDEIRKLGGEMIDRIANVAEPFGKVGKALDAAVQSYNGAVASLESRLLPTARKMGELGAPATKEVPPLERLDTASRTLPAELAADA